MLFIVFYIMYEDHKILFYSYTLLKMSYTYTYKIISCAFYTKSTRTIFLTTVRAVSVSDTSPWLFCIPWSRLPTFGYEESCESINMSSAITLIMEARVWENTWEIQVIELFERNLYRELESKSYSLVWLLLRVQSIKLSIYWCAYSSPLSKYFYKIEYLAFAVPFFFASISGIRTS